MLFTALRLFIFSSILASFFVVVAQRTLNNTSFILGRSHCDYCHTPLKFRHLIPILSYYFQKGRCDFCHHPLSPIYPLAEITFALITPFLILLNFPNFFLITLIHILLFIMAISDLTTLIVPDRWQVLLAILALFSFFQTISSEKIYSHLLLAGGLMLLFFFLSKGNHSKIGGADIKCLLILSFILSPMQFSLLLLLSSGLMVAVFFGMWGLGYKLSTLKLPFLPAIWLGFDVVLCMPFVF